MTDASAGGRIGKLWHRKLMQLDDEYLSLAKRITDDDDLSREEQLRRAKCVYMAKAVDIIERALGEYQSPILTALSEALLKTARGTPPSAFTVTKGENIRGSPGISYSLAYFQALAAVVLQLASDHGARGKRLSDWKSKIVRTLGRSGLKYKPNTVSKWRQQCKDGEHPAASVYRSVHDQLRARSDSPEEALEALVKLLRQWPQTKI